ncbi:hypothetical protein [Microbacterium dauci]|uniref:DUF3558 domain-containing protein n=1 Tax=Microbacterium dauci TaxID=3048008 RepID=A0ABT6ZCN6_9MICO|nr:hypothetical protein [Microbacterium sp. LX3-4]MDJ1113922.1 hypothetical protein [Microbacterium sp. LX3-4]
MVRATGRFTALALGAAALLALAGCAASTPDAAPTAGAPSTSPSTAALPEAPTIALPSTCDGMLTVDTIGGILDESWVDDGAPGSPADELPGPTARAAAAEAAETLACAWHPETTSDDVVAGYAMRIEQAVRADLVTAFGASDAYEPILLEGADIAFSASEQMGTAQETTVYAFVGDTWLAFAAPLRADQLVPIAAAAVANVTA